MNKAITATNGLPTLADWMDPLEQAVRKGGARPPAEPPGGGGIAGDRAFAVPR